MKSAIVTLWVFIWLLATNGVNAAPLSQFDNSKVTFSLPAGWIMGEVAAIKKTASGHFIVFNRGQHQLLEFDEQHRFVKEIGQGLFISPHGLRIDKQGNIWTTDSDTQLVLRFTPSGEVTMVLGKKGKAGTGWFDKDRNVVFFNKPLDVALDSMNNIYVVDKGNSRIVKLDADGNLVKFWGKQGSKLGEFNFAHSIDIDEQDRIYVADRENKRIQRFNTDGKSLGAWTNIGYPYVITIADNTLWMTDARFEKVLQLDLEGKILASYQGKVGRNPGQFSSVHGIDVDSMGSVWVTQIYNWGGVNRLNKAF